MKTIVVMPNGWVLVGELEGKTNLRNASVIRRWGTSSGLGELVNGPFPNTVCDKIGDVSIGKKVFSFEAKGWK